MFALMALALAVANGDPAVAKAVAGNSDRASVCLVPCQYHMLIVNGFLIEGTRPKPFISSCRCLFEVTWLQIY